jgi:hypothetical protein
MPDNYRNPKGGRVRAWLVTWNDKAYLIASRRRETAIKCLWQILCANIDKDEIGPIAARRAPNWDRWAVAAPDGTIRDAS